MTDLSTKYLGLKLKNPIIAASSGLTKDVASVRRLVEAGVGAVVLKSLFEEQMSEQAHELSLTAGTGEAFDYINSYVRSNSLEEYLAFIAECKKTCPVPVIASINCFSGGDWVKFASRIEKAGADALELNIFYLPTSKKDSSAAVEKRYFDTAASVAAGVKIPVSVKMSKYFTNPLYVADQLYIRGVRGVVMFNRLYRPDIDVNGLSFQPGNIFSSAAELSDPLRWIGLASHEVDTLDYAASTGVHKGDDVVKMLLAGASAVEICTALYEGGNAVVGYMLSSLERWMDNNSYTSVKEFKGSMNARQRGDAAIFERSQFMKYYSNR